MNRNDLPKAFLDQMQEILGEEFESFLEALEDKTPVSLRLNPLKPAADFPDKSPIPWVPNGYYLPERPKFYLDPLIYAGAYYVQEASSMFYALADEFEGRDLKILDLCAAPGGKSTLIASLMSENSLLVSNEIVGSRARILEENISRWGHPNCVVTNNRPADFSQLKGFFDLILVDAPCSGEGMFRKDPDVIGHWNQRAVKEAARRQKEILEAVTPALALGGRLLYSTCTYNRDENEEILAWLLASEPGAYRMIAPRDLPDYGLTAGDTTPYGPEMAHARHAYPHKVKGEGFFFALLDKEEAHTSFDTKSEDIRPRRDFKKGKSKNFKKEGREKKHRPPQTVTAKDLKSLEKWLAHPEGYELEVMGENVHAFPKRWVDEIRELAKHLRVLNAGVRMGKYKGNALIPAHDLAMSVAHSDKIPRIEVELEAALHFLKRGEFNPETGNLRGWALITYRSIPLGWVKVLDNRVNNHFPREQRIRAEIRLD